VTDLGDRHLAPFGCIEPHEPLLAQPPAGQRIFKLMSVENLIRSVEGRYLHFNRVDHYADFALADIHDGEELPLDVAGNCSSTFEKAPHFSLSDYYAQSRRRTYACCFSLENSAHIWGNYGLGSAMGQVALEFDFDHMRQRINAGLAGGTLMAGTNQCRQIFSVNYGQVSYVDRANHRANSDYAANPIQYAYLKHQDYADEQELRVTLSAMGMGRFMLADGRELEFPPALQLAFDYHGAIADGTIVQILTGASTNLRHLERGLHRLGIGKAL
jgi:hypothetical protein